MKKCAKGVVYIALYVDDNLMVGNTRVIYEEIEANGFVIKVVEGLQDYLFCKVKFSLDKKRAWLGKPHLIKSVKK